MTTGGDGSEAQEPCLIVRLIWKADADDLGVGRDVEILV